MSIYLIGMMGVGKTTVGKKLSDYLQYRFIDLDQAIEEHCKMSIAEIFEQYGEEYFRQVEEAVLKQTTTLSDVVVATGGGIVEIPGNCELLKLQQTFFLQGSIDLLWERVQKTTHRPLAVNRDVFEARYQRRASLYEDTAQVVIQVDHKMLNDIVAEMLYYLAK